MNAASVSTILKEGTIIYTRLGSNPNGAWYQNIVCKSESSTVCIPLIDTYLQSLIMIGTSISLKFGNEYFEYLFEGVVSNIKVDYLGLITVNVNKAEERINTRAYPRYDIYLASTISPLWSETPYFCIVTNLSFIGIAFASKYQFDSGEECDSSIYLPNHKIIRSKGKIVRKSVFNNIIEYGIHFTELTEENSCLLSDYLTELDEDKVRLQNLVLEYV